MVYKLWYAICLYLMVVGEWLIQLFVLDPFNFSLSRSLRKLGKQIMQAKKRGNAVLLYLMVNQY